MRSFGSSTLEAEAQAGAQQASTDAAKTLYTQHAKKSGSLFY